jgi:hypothetical protein
MAKKTRIRFNAEPQHMLHIDARTSIAGGKEADVDEDVAAALVAADWADVTVVGGAEPEPSWPGTHAELDEIAAKVAVIWPTPAEGKKTLTVADKQAALELAGHTPESVLVVASDPPTNQGEAE